MSVIAAGLPESRAESLPDAVRHMMDRDQYELPVLPEVAAQLMRLTADVDCDPAEIVPLIRRDQSLTTHLLRIANSARYGTGVNISSIQQAVARLGLLRLREIVVLISCRCRIFDVAGFEADVRDSFRNSLAAAAFAQEIARVRRLNVEEAFLTGLLHDVGRPILLQALNDRRQNGSLVACDDELRQAAEDHRVALAARLITAWELSERVAEVVRHQRAPQNAAASVAQAAVLRLALDLTDKLLSPQGAISVTDFSDELVSLLVLYPEHVDRIVSKQGEVVAWVDSTV